MDESTVEFRVWCRSFGGRMDYDHDWAITTNGELLCLDSDAFGTGNEAWLPVSNPSSYIPLRFTGLLDKKNKKIYEGDVVKCENTLPSLRYWVIEWDDHRWSPFHRVLPARMEIIGNIYENPELLK